MIVTISTSSELFFAMKYRASYLWASVHGSLKPEFNGMGLVLLISFGRPAHLFPFDTQVVPVYSPKLTPLRILRSLPKGSIGKC
jgi:hypothetical protein